jgi:hypothetical protein
MADAPGPSAEESTGQDVAALSRVVCYCFGLITTPSAAMRSV